MSDVAQMLFLRLFLRAGPWFKLNSLAYSECPNVPATAAELEAAGLAESLKKAPKKERMAAVRCLTMLEVQSLLAGLEMLPQRRGGRGLNRAEVVSLLHRGLESPSKVLTVLYCHSCSCAISGIQESASLILRSTRDVGIPFTVSLRYIALLTTGSRPAAISVIDPWVGDWWLRWWVQRNLNAGFIMLYDFWSSPKHCTTCTYLFAFMRMYSP